MKFDSSRAWSEAMQAIIANREVVLALAGVFFLLPQLAFVLFFPEPETVAGADQKQMMAAMQAYYVSIAPVLIPMLLAQALGTLALLCLLDTERRPTVGEAIGAGARGLASYLGAQLLSGFAMGLVGVFFAGVLGAAAGMAGAVVGVVIMLLFMIALSIRLALTAPVVAVEKVLNPLAAIARSWRLTRGNTSRILGFFAMLLIAMFVVMIFVGILTLPISLLLSAETARVVSGILQAVLTSLMAVCFVAVIGQVHRQLAGPSAESAADPFA